MGNAGNAAKRGPLNKGKIVGPKAPFNLKDIWALRVRFQMEHRVRELALFNLGVDSKLRGCDLVALRVLMYAMGTMVATRAIVMQHKTQRPVQFEITQGTRDALLEWIKQAQLKPGHYLFPGRPTTHLIWGPDSTPGSWALSRRSGPGPRRLWDAFDAEDKCDVDRPAHAESARRAVAAWSIQT